MKRRLISLLLALALSIGLVLPAYAETAATENTEVVHLDTCLENCALEDCACECHQAAEHTHDEQTHAEGCADDCAVEGCACECHVVTETPTEETVQHVTMCGGENCLITDCSCQCHAEPEVTEEPTEAPSEEATEAPSEEPTEAPSEEPTEAPSEEPTEGDSNVETLYNAIMACTTAAEVEALLSNMTPEQQAAFVAALSEEQVAAMDEYLDKLYDTPAVTYPAVDNAVNYSNAAPFKPPVVGEAPALFRLIRAAAAASTDVDNGLSLNKTVKDNGSDSYTLTLEAWATGAKTIISTSESVPTDIVLVLDQSGSMTYCMYPGCDDQNCDGKHGNSSYTAVYDVSETDDREYYIYSYGGYSQVHYCSSCDGWFTNQHGYRHNGTEYTPKTSASGSGTTFYIDNTTVYDSRITALKNALTNFASSVATKAKGADGVLGTEDDVDHTISVIGFASGRNYNGTNYNYGNTELFVGSQTYTYNAGSSNSASNANAAQQHYDDAPQDMSTDAGVTNVNASINALAASGGTLINLGMEMANGVLNANQPAEGEKRNQVVIVFTDGTPGWSGYDSDVADAAIATSTTIKNGGATVYSVGIFGGADATSAGSNANNASDTQKANYFMQRVSSNTAYPQTPSYYLSASDSATLNNIFQTISQNIESGGSSITLDEQAVVKDVITDQFELPEGANADSIKVYTADYIAADTFADPVESDATVSISDDGKTITVTDFDYAEYWVGTETAANGTVSYRGKKLIIEIPIEVREGFLGGNGVYTNGAGSGVYEDSSAETPIEEFESPTVDVEIKDITVTAPKYNVYLLGGVDADTLLDGLTVESGDTVIDLDPTAVNFGLASWQNAYVTIDTGDLNDLTSLTDDATYTATVGIEPNSEGTVSAKTGSGTGAINVFKPEITFNDTAINAGVLAVYADNGGSVVWKHGDTTASVVTMTGDVPDLTYDYDHKAAAFTEDTKVSVTVFMGEGENEVEVTPYVTFEHSDCSFENITCTWAEEDEGIPGAEFIVHIKSFDLTITKTGADTAKDPDQTFIFYITGPNNYSQTVIIKGNGSVTIAGLPVGDYIITEDTSWSWRYECANATQAVKPSDVSGGKATVTFNNVRNDDQWLDGNTMAENIFNVLK